MNKEYRLVAEIYGGKLIITKQDGSNFEIVSTPNTNAGKFPTLGFGAQSPAVAVLQALLCYYGHKIDIDGVFGMNTRAATVEFQKACAISTDGYVSRETWTKLLEG